MKIFLLLAVLFVLPSAICAAPFNWTTFNVTDDWCISGFANDYGAVNITIDMNQGDYNNISAVYLTMYTPGFSETVQLRWHIIYGFGEVSDPSNIVDDLCGAYCYAGITVDPTRFYANFSYQINPSATYPGSLQWKLVVVTDFGSQTIYPPNVTLGLTDTGYLLACGGNTQASGSGNTYGWLSYSVWRGGEDYLPGATSRSTVDFFDTVTFRYIYDVPLNDNVFIYIKNLTGVQYSINVTSNVKWKWQHISLPRGHNLSHGHYVVVLNDTTSAITLCQRDLYLYRPAWEWVVSGDSVYYSKPGVGSIMDEASIEIKCKNYAYWRDSIDAYTPFGAEAQMAIIVSKITGSQYYMLKTDSIYLFNGTSRNEDLVGYWTPEIPDPGTVPGGDSPYINVKLYLYLNRDVEYLMQPGAGENITTLVYEYNTTLQPYALGGGAVDEWAFALGFPKRLTRFLVALGISAVVMILVVNFVELNAFSSLMFFFAIMMGWSIIGWFPIWIPSFVLILLGGMLFMGVTSEGGSGGPTSAMFEELTS